MKSIAQFVMVLAVVAAATPAGPLAQARGAQSSKPQPASSSIKVFEGAG